MSGKVHTHSSHAGASAAVAVAREGAAETRYRLLFERNPVGLYRTTLEGRILDCNDACARIFGFATREEFLSHHTSEFYFDSAERERSIGRLQREGVVRNLELRMRRRDGATVWALESAIMLSSGDEPPVCEGSLVDITDLKRMDERFEIERAHLEQLFENTPEAIATLDNHYKILRLNREFTRLFGYTSDDACGHDINDLIVPIDRHQEGLKVSQLLTQGQSVNIETVRRRKDGTLVDVSVLGTPIRMASGEMGHYAIYRDISERKHAERLQSALYRIANLATSAVDLQQLYKTIHSILRELMFAKNCYVALYDEHSDMVSFPYFVDEKDPPQKPHKFRKGLTEYVLRTGEPLLATPEKLDELIRLGDFQRTASPSLDWMGVPLSSSSGKPFGALVVQSYREHVRYGEAEKEILMFVSQQIARAIETGRQQEALRESENKFRALAVSAAPAIYIFDDKKFLYVNPGAEKLFGYTSEELLALDDPWVLVHPDLREQIRARGKARLHGENPVPRYECKIVTKSGETRWVDISSGMLQYEGKPAGIATSVDITERKRSEVLQSALYRIAEKTSSAGDLKEFYTYIHQVVGELMYARNFYIALYDKATQMLSFPYFEDEFDPTPARKHLGRGLTEFVLRSGRPLLATPDVFEDLVQQGEVESIGAPSLDWLGVPLIMGEETTGALVVQTYKENIRYGEAEKDILTFVARNVATAIEHKRHQEELRLSEARYRSLVQSAVYGIFSATVEGKFLAVNRALLNILGYRSEAELFALNFRDQVLADTPSRDQLAEQLRSSKTWDGLELQMRRRDGTAISVRVSGRVAADPDGQPLYCECIAEDITERRALEQQLRQAQKMEAVGRLAGGVAHDFNNLLTVIKGYTEIVREDLAGDYVHARELDEALRASERAATLTRQLLAFSRQQVMAPRVLNLNAVVHNMNALLTRLLGEDVHLEVQLDPKCGNVKADPSQFEQVIMNLAVNARHAMPNGGRLRLQTSNVELEEEWAREHMGAHAGRYVLMCITDNGTGMDEKTKARLFEPFFTTKEQGKGTGLGLSTVYGIVKQSGGYISVYSELAVGTTFKIYLPRVDAAPDRPSSSGMVLPTNRGSETVLLVEDEEGVRKLVHQLISRQGYKVLEARSGEEALQIAQSHDGKIDLLLTDLVLSNMSGRELSERMRKQDEKIKVLYMSGYTDDAILHAGMLTEGARFIQKPFTAASLSQRLRELLDKS